MEGLAIIGAMGLMITIVLGGLLFFPRIFIGAVVVLVVLFAVWLIYIFVHSILGEDEEDADAWDDF